MFVIESAIAKAADVLGIPASDIQEKNLLRTGDLFPYGQVAESEANETWKQAVDLYRLDEIKKEVAAFNKENDLYKRGLALMPICFGISFTKTLMNQARALVHIYADGSVGVSTGAVEMGQGVNTKIMQVASAVFSLPASRIRINTTNTYRIANTSPTAASAAADLNGRATEIACNKILERLRESAAEELSVQPGNISFRDEWVYVDGEKSSLDWHKLVMTSYHKRINLSEHAHYAPPGIYFDAHKEKGHPFTYHVYGTAIITVTVDCIRGTYEFDAVKMVHDFGKSMNTIIDRGQCEGGVVQGIGWMTMEEIIFDKEGNFKSNALSTYKVPDIYAAPKEIIINALQTNKENLAVFGSKAVGEPPLLYGLGAYFALRNAIQAYNPGAALPFDAPMTPEKLLMLLYSKNEVPQTV
jgi:xanthine dehydrogenase large subunit